MGQHFCDAVRHPFGIAPFQARARQPVQPVLWGFPDRNFRGVFVFQFVQGKVAPCGDVCAAVYCICMACKNPQHGCFVAHMSFGVGQGLMPDIVNPQAFADAGQNIGQPPARAAVHHWRGRGNGGEAEPFCQCIQPIKSRPVLPVITGRHQQ